MIKRHIGLSLAIVGFVTNLIAVLSLRSVLSPWLFWLAIFVPGVGPVASTFALFTTHYGIVAYISYILCGAFAACTKKYWVIRQMDGSEK